VNDFTRAINITAPQSVCTVYFRPMPNQDPDALLRRAEAAAKRCGIDFEVTRCCKSLYIDPQSPYVQAMLKLTGNTAARTVCYGTDGCVFAELPNLVVFGPGHIAQAHTHDEWIALQQLQLGTEMYEKCIRHWCRDAVQSGNLQKE
jgi:acetylornithine deacetylase